MNGSKKMGFPTQHYLKLIQKLRAEYEEVPTRKMKAWINQNRFCLSQLAAMWRSSLFTPTPDPYYEELTESMARLFELIDPLFFVDLELPEGAPRQSYLYQISEWFLNAPSGQKIRAIGQATELRNEIERFKEECESEIFPDYDFFNRDEELARLKDQIERVRALEKRPYAVMDSAFTGILSEISHEFSTIKELFRDSSDSSTSAIISNENMDIIR